MLLVGGPADQTARLRAIQFLWFYISSASLVAINGDFSSFGETENESGRLILTLISLILSLLVIFYTFRTAYSDPGLLLPSPPLRLPPPPPVSAPPPPDASPEVHAAVLDQLLAERRRNVQRSSTPRYVKCRYVCPPTVTAYTYHPVLACGQDGKPKGLSAVLSSCPTCEIVRPPNSHHCSVCDACVSEFDHHCVWLNCCVGEGNRRSFFLLLMWNFVWLAFNAVLIPVKGARGGKAAKTYPPPREQPGDKAWQALLLTALSFVVVSLMWNMLRRRCSNLFCCLSPALRRCCCSEQSFEEILMKAMCLVFAPGLGLCRSSLSALSSPLLRYLPGAKLCCCCCSFTSATILEYMQSKAWKRAQAGARKKAPAALFLLLLYLFFYDQMLRGGSPPKLARSLVYILPACLICPILTFVAISFTEIQLMILGKATTSKAFFKPGKGGGGGAHSHGGGGGWARLKAILLAGGGLTAPPSGRERLFKDGGDKASLALASSHEQSRAAATGGKPTRRASVKDAVVDAFVAAGKVGGAVVMVAAGEVDRVAQAVKSKQRKNVQERGGKGRFASLSTDGDVDEDEDRDEAGGSFGDDIELQDIKGGVAKEEFPDFDIDDASPEDDVESLIAKMTAFDAGRGRMKSNKLGWLWAVGMFLTGQRVQVWAVSEEQNSGDLEDNRPPMIDEAKAKGESCVPLLHEWRPRKGDVGFLDFGVVVGTMNTRSRGTGTLEVREERVSKVTARRESVENYY